MQNQPPTLAPEQELIRMLQEASPAQFHAMLLEMAEQSLDLAIHAMNEGDRAGKSRHLSRVSAIIQDLSGRVNLVDGGELAVNLSRIYSWWIDVLFEAGQSDQLPRLRTLGHQMRDMRSSWEELDPHTTPQGLSQAV